MALANTTLASACGASDTKIVVASATGIAIGHKVLIDGEVFQVTKGYVAGSVTVPVLRGQNGTFADAHPTGAKVRVGASSDSQWGAQAPQTDVQFPIMAPARLRQSYTAAGAITLPSPGNDMVAYINGTSVCAMTVAAPATSLDGSLLYIASNGAAAHTVTFASGLSGAGTSYDVLTVNATAPVLLGPFMAVNGFWQAPVGVAMSGTVTNITAGVA
jgi:hypothetical protein